MSARQAASSLRARDLASAFDRSFASARPAAPPPMMDFLAVRIGGDPHAIALADVDRLAPAGRITPLPGAPPVCLGVAGLRASATPVYDLRALLGYQGEAAIGPWLALIAGAPAALAFDAMEGRLRAPQEALATADGDQSGRPHVRGVLKADGMVRPVIDMRSVVEAIGAVARGGAASA